MAEGVMDEGARSHGDWNVVWKKKHKKTLKSASGNSDGDRITAAVERRREDFKVICKLAEVGAAVECCNLT